MAETFEEMFDRVVTEYVTTSDRILLVRAVAKWQAERDAEILKTESNRLTELGTYSDDAEYVMSLSMAILKAADEL